MWTDEAIDTLRRLALEGRSASSIAAALGAPSRNAVIGKANRIGVKLGGCELLSALRGAGGRGAAAAGDPSLRAPLRRADPAAAGGDSSLRAHLRRARPHACPADRWVTK